MKSKPQDFLISIFYICTELEKINNIKIKKEETQIRLFNIFPLNNLLGKNIYIDTATLISNFLGDESTPKYLKTYKKENKYNNIKYLIN